MSSNIQSFLRASAHSRPLPASAIVYEERMIKGKEGVRLLRAPSIESDVVWKARLIRFAYNILRPKLGEPYSAETLISTIRDHFPLSSQQSENEANAVVAKFRGSFGNVSYLSPQGFYDFNGKDQTATMHKAPRPANVCFAEVKYNLPLARLGAPFDEYQRCDMTYFLHLPQSLPGKSLTLISQSNPSCDGTVRRSLFSTATNLKSKFSSTPGRVASVGNNVAPLSVVNIPGVSTPPIITTTASPSSSAGMPIGGSSRDLIPGSSMRFFPGLSTTTAVGPSTTNSNSSFDAIKVKLAPKTA